MFKSIKDWWNKRKNRPKPTPRGPVPMVGGGPLLWGQSRRQRMEETQAAVREVLREGQKQPFNISAPEITPGLLEGLIQILQEREEEMRKEAEREEALQLARQTAEMQIQDEAMKEGGSLKERLAGIEKRLNLIVDFLNGHKEALDDL